MLPEDFPKPIVIPHEGKVDLVKSIPRKLRAWQTPDTRFVIVRDQDSADCNMVKQQLVSLCEKAGRPDSLIRIACHELESWFLGDLQTVATVFDLPRVAKLDNKQTYRDPDQLSSRELKKLVPRPRGFDELGASRRPGGKARGGRWVGPATDEQRSNRG